MTSIPKPGPRLLFDMNGYQWAVFMAAWVGWGFDVFDGLLFNYVAPTCVPTLLHIPIGSHAAQAATLQWTGALTSVLLLGWAAGGIIFGRFADRFGRSKTLLVTMLLYSLGTAACAGAPNIWVLLLCRVVAALGIGGEWAAGAAMVAEVVPEKRRVEAGALLYTSAPLGLFLATWVTHQLAGPASDPATAWRHVFLAGLAPAAAAFLFRIFVREPERWKRAVAETGAGGIRELFSPQYRALTVSGLCMAITALIAWWSCNGFIPTIANGLSRVTAAQLHLAPQAARELASRYRDIATNSFNWGGLIGTLLTVPLAKSMGRKPMFFLYYLASGLAIFTTFGLGLPAETRLRMYFLIGLTVFGVFGSFTYYLPELFPTRLRGTGAGFTYNIGRVIASIGPFLIGSVASRGADALAVALRALTFVGIFPLLGLLTLPLVIETRGRELAD